MSSDPQVLISTMLAAIDYEIVLHNDLGLADQEVALLFMVVITWLLE